MLAVAVAELTLDHFNLQAVKVAVVTVEILRPMQQLEQ
jgi:hypothetical protein